MDEEMAKVDFGFCRSVKSMSSKCFRFSTVSMTLLFVGIAPAQCLAGGSVDSSTKLGQLKPLSVREYFEAVYDATKNLDKNQSEYFISPGLNPKEKLTVRELLGEIKSELGDEDLSLEKAQSAPQAFTLGGTMGSKRGGMAIWKKDVFPVDYFVRKSEFLSTGKSYSQVTLMTQVANQPWLKWETSKLTYQSSGASKRILDLLREGSGPSVKLRVYRGTTSLEGHLFEMASEVFHSSGLPENWKTILENDLQALDGEASKEVKAYEELFQQKIISSEELKSVIAHAQRISNSNENIRKEFATVNSPSEQKSFFMGTLRRLQDSSSFLGTFTTPSVERAKVFSKGSVISFELNWEDLEKLRNEKELYVGLEKMESGNDADVQAELGFFSNPQSKEKNLIQTLIEAFKDNTSTPAGSIFN